MPPCFGNMPWMARRLNLLILLVTAALLTAAVTAFAASDPERPKQWGLDMVGADKAHETATGKGAIVAVVDTGVMTTHRDLAGRLLPGYDFVNDDADPSDDNGHGTHVSGIVAADTGNGVGVASVAPEAKILPVKALDAEGGGDATGIAKAIDFAVAHQADVINLSLSDTVPLRALIGGRDEMDDAVDRALDKGVIVVAAAGNSGLPVCANPNGGGRLLCVGAVDRNRNRTLYSDFGDGLAITAPGGAGTFNAEDDILSTWNNGAYEFLAGTSQATPHVSGVAALLVSMGVRGQAAVNLILKTASDAGPPGPDSDYGAGIVDAAAAVAAAKTAAPAGGGGVAGAGRASVRSPQKIATVLRRGVLVSCTPTAAGRCSAVVVRKGRTLARGSKQAAAGKRTLFRAPTTKAGRATLRRAKRLRATVRVRLPGGQPVSRPVTLAR